MTDAKTTARAAFATGMVAAARLEAGGYIAHCPCGWAFVVPTFGMIERHAEQCPAVRVRADEDRIHLLDRIREIRAMVREEIGDVGPEDTTPVTELITEIERYRKVRAGIDAGGAW